MFTAKVISDGRLFMAQIEEGTSRDALNLEKGKTYYGLVFDSGPTQTQYVEYSEAKPALFKGIDLENTPGDFRLILLRRNPPTQT